MPRQTVKERAYGGYHENMRVRHANERDIPQLIDLGRLMHAESSFAHMDFDAMVLGEYLLRMLHHDEGLVLVAADKGRIAGAFLGVTVQSYFGRDRIACDIALFVAPDTRGQHVGQELVSHFHAWALLQGAKRIQISNSAGMNDEAFVNLVGAGAGMERSGSIMFRRVED